MENGLQPSGEEVDAVAQGTQLADTTEKGTDRWRLTLMSRFGRRRTVSREQLVGEQSVRYDNLYPN